MIPVSLNPQALQYSKRTLLGIAMLLFLSALLFSGAHIARADDGFETEAAAQAGSTTSAESEDKEANLPGGVRQEWWGSVQALIEREMHFIAPAGDGDAGYSAINQRQHLQFHFPDEGGFWVTSLSPWPDRELPVRSEVRQPAWRWGLRPARLTIDDRLYELGLPASAAVTENRLEQEYRLADHGLLMEETFFTERFVNETDGLRQNFTLGTRPTGPQDHPLTLLLSSTGDLRVELDGDGQGITLRDELGASRLFYRDLHIYDAGDREYSGWFEVQSSATGEQTVSIVVDDAGAVYPLTIDPLTGTTTDPAWSITGETNGDALGWTVASAGDVNGDGYVDLIIGAPLYGGSDTGQILVYSGGPGGIGGRLLSQTSVVANHYMGWSVAGVGDVNGDGYSDLAIGGPGYDGDKGLVEVYYGSDHGLEFGIGLTGVANSNFGISVAGAGDVNGDGYADVAVGAGNFDSGKGKAYVFYGSATGITGSVASPSFGFTGENPGDNLGYTISGAGDVNGDGYADLAVGAPYAGASDQGAVYVFYGSSTGLPAGSSVSVDFFASGKATGDEFGRSVSISGDLNGDGYSDLAVGAPAEASSKGAVYVFYGGSSGLTGSTADPGDSLAGEAANDSFSWSISSAGDVNGDGYADLAVGATNAGGSGGMVYVFHGGSGGLLGTSASPAFSAIGEASGDTLGASVSIIGDANGDGYADLAAGAINAGDDEQGMVYVFHGGGDGLVPGFNAGGEGPGGQFGSDVAGIGDVNGDGYADLAVGAYSFGVSKGKVYVFHGGPNGLTGTSATPAFSVEGEHDYNHFGYSVAGAGDVNSDGYADLAVGSSLYGGFTGKIYVFYGGAGGLSGTASSADFTAVGETDHNAFGSTVAGAGDVNGDGYADLAVSAFDYDGGRGKIYVFHGGPSGLTGSATNAAFTATGQAAGHYFGHALAGAGDLDGDGFADLAVGAPAVGGYKGKVYVFHGWTTGLSGTAEDPDFSVKGQNEGDWFGSALAGIGDVNGDGFAELAIGASGVGEDKGKVYVFYGGHAGLVGTAGSPDFSATGEAAFNAFGEAVAGAGDINGDGYADLAVGAPDASLYLGKVYVFYGGVWGLTGSAASPSFSATGLDAGGEMGCSVSGLGDVNGDGFGDLAAGANFANADAGKVYAFYGGGGGGRPVMARQVTAVGGQKLVQPWALSGADDSLKVGLTATSPVGRQRVKLQVETCPQSWPFHSGECVVAVSPTWNDVTSSKAGIALTQMVSGLDRGSLQHWRARVLYAPYTVTASGITPPPNPAHGPWRRFHAQAVEADVRMTPITDLSMLKFVSHTDSSIGRPLEYTLSFTNLGPGVAGSVEIQDRVPNGATLERSQIVTHGGDFTVDQTSGPPNMKWVISDLPSNAGGTIVLRVAIADDPALAGTVIRNTATITAATDTSAGNNSATVQTQINQIYTIGGDVQGLQGSGLVLQNNGDDDLAVTSDGRWVFPTQYIDGSSYSVTVRSQPLNPSQTCTVSNGTGTIAGANVTNVRVVCATNTYTVGVTVSGLAGSGLVLQNNGGNDLAVAANGSFVFAKPLADGSSYNVTVKSQPRNPDQVCTVSNGTGTIAGANVTNVRVVCATNTYTVGVTVSGLTGSGLVLQNNGGNDLAVAANGSFVFAKPLADGSSYNVTVKSQPRNPDQVCTVSNGTGTIGGANVTNVVVSCAEDVSDDHGICLPVILR